MSLETCSFKRSHPPEMGETHNAAVAAREGQGQDQATDGRLSLTQVTVSLAEVRQKAGKQEKVQSGRKGPLGRKGDSAFWATLE